MTQEPRLVAHRGYAAHFPENSLLAIQAAVEAGAHYIEFDVQVTSDGIPVLFHDRDCRRMCGQNGAIHDYSYAQLSRFSVSEFGRFGYRYAGNRITTLSEAIGYLSNFPFVRVFVELKRISLHVLGIDTVLDKVLPILSAAQQQSVVISYSLNTLKAVRERSGHAIGAVFDKWSGRKHPLVKHLKPEFLFTDIDELPRWGKLSCPQCELAVYECTDPEKALRVYRRGVDLVETFAIGEMLQAIRLIPENR